MTNFSTEIDISRLFVLNNLFKYIKQSDNSSKYPYHITKKILMLLMFAPSNYKNRINEYSYIKLTASELKESLEKYFDTYISLNKLTEHLHMLSTNFQSMYSDKNNLLARIELNNDDIAYQFQYNCGWRKIGFIPDFGRITLKYSDLNQYGTKLPEMIIMSLIIIATQTEKDQPNLILNERNIEKMFKFNNYDIQKLCDLLGVIKLTKFDMLTNNEKYLADVQQNIKQQVIRGIYFSDEDIKTISDFLNKYRTVLNHENIMKLKDIIYHNIDKFDRNRWMEVDTRHYYCQANQINSYFRESEMSSKKALDLQCRFSKGSRKESSVQHSDKSSEQCSQEHVGDVDQSVVSVNEKGTIEPPKKPSIILGKISKIEDFQDFCVECRDLFERAKRNFKTQKIAFEIKKQLISVLKTSDNPKKQVFINELNKINKLNDIFISPIFNKDFIKYRDIDEIILSGYYDMNEYNLNRIDKSLYINDNKLTDILNPICHDHSDWENYDHDLFIEDITKAYENEKLSESQKEYVQSRIDDMKNKKYLHDRKKSRNEMRDRLNYKHALYYILMYRKFENVEDLKKFINSESTCHRKISSLFTCLYHEINLITTNNLFKNFVKYPLDEKNIELTKNYFYINLFDRNVIAHNLKIVDEVIDMVNKKIEEKERESKIISNEEQMILDKMKELGLTLYDIGNKKFKLMIFELTLKKITMEDVTKRLMGR